MSVIYDATYDGTWRDLSTGVDPAQSVTEFSPAFDHPGIPVEGPIETRLEGPWGLPWWEGLEDPYCVVDVPQSPTPLPWSPNEDVGNEPRIAAYEGAYRTRGPVQAWGHEVSGGLWGDQAIGRIMRFPANMPERFDPYGVWNTDPRDELASAMAVSDLPYQNDTEVTTNLLLWPNVWGRW